MNYKPFKNNVLADNIIRALYEFLKLNSNDIYSYNMTYNCNLNINEIIFTNCTVKSKSLHVLFTIRNKDINYKKFIAFIRKQIIKFLNRKFKKNNLPRIFFRHNKRYDQNINQMVLNTINTMNNKNKITKEINDDETFKEEN